MASILTSVTRNKSGAIIRGVRVMRSQYDKTTKRDNLRYLGTIPQGTIDIPPAVATNLSPTEQKILTQELIVAAHMYWNERNESLKSQLLTAQKETACFALSLSRSQRTDTQQSNNDDPQ
jgi:hypothetical protein